MCRRSALRYKKGSGSHRPDLGRGPVDAAGVARGGAAQLGAHGGALAGRCVRQTRCPTTGEDGTFIRSDCNCLDVNDRARGPHFLCPSGTCPDVRLADAHSARVSYSQTRSKTGFGCGVGWEVSEGCEPRPEALSPSACTPLPERMSR